MATIKRQDVYDFLNKKHQFFGMTYTKADGSTRKALCLLHVKNPKHVPAPGSGSRPGQTAAEAYRYNDNLKYFDCHAEGTPGPDQKAGKGAYRTAKISSIQSIRTDGQTYDVID